MISGIESVAMYIQLQPRRSQAFDGRPDKVRVWSGLVAFLQDVRGEVKVYILKECL